VATPHSSASKLQATLVVYQHHYLDDSPLALPTGKVVSIGRNYLDHILDLTLRDLPQFVKRIAWLSSPWLSSPWRIDAVSGKG